MRDVFQKPGFLIGNRYGKIPHLYPTHQYSKLIETYIGTELNTIIKGLIKRSSSFPCRKAEINPSKNPINVGFGNSI